MALHYAIKHIVWLRQFMEEMGLGSVVGKPTLVYADNKQANTCNLCHEHLVTSGNMYFRTSYHYNKEEVEDGTVAVRYTHTSTNYSDSSKGPYLVLPNRDTTPVTLMGHYLTWRPNLPYPACSSHCLIQVRRSPGRRAAAARTAAMRLRGLRWRRADEAWPPPAQYGCG